MMLPQLLALSLVLAPNVVSAAIFPKNSLVKMIDHKGFKNAMKENMTSLVAFVAPWCGHCQRMAPEYSKAALGLHPLVPLYAVDCDASENKRLCADQGVKGFPTVKLFPRGKDMKPIEFTGPQRSASELFYFAQNNVPSKLNKVHYLEDLDKNINKPEVINKPRALLMKKNNKMPLLWTTLANKYRDDIVFYTHRDRRGKSSVALGFEKGEDGVPKVLIYPPGETKPVQFMGILKFDSLSNFLDSLIDGSVDLATLNAAAAAEDFIPDPAELEIERQQEAEMLKLAHGGFADMIDFEAAVRDGDAKNFHGKNGYPGSMGGIPQAGGAGKEKAKEPEKEKSTKKKIRMPMTDEAGQIVMDVTEGAATATATATEADVSTEPQVEPVPESQPEAENLEDESQEPEKGGEDAPTPEASAEPSNSAEEAERVKDEL